MMKLLIYESDLLLLNKLKSILGSFDIFESVRIVNDEDSCLKLVSEQVFDFFVLRFENDKFKDLLIQTMPNIVNLPVLCFSTSTDVSEFSKLEQVQLSVKKFKLIHLLSALSDLIPKEVKNERTQLFLDYLPIKISLIKKLKVYPCDFYIKLSADKHVKILSGNLDVNIDFLDRYSSRNITDFFVTRSDFYKYSDDLFSRILPPAENFTNKESFYSQSLEAIKDIVSEIGVNENVIGLTTELIDSAVADLKDPELLDLLNKFKFSKDRYIYDHSMLTATFAVSLCEKFDWRSRQVMQKLVFASMFHDFAIVDPRLAFVDSSFKANPDLSSLHKYEISNHAEVMCQILSRNKSISSEVLGIVAKHHEGREEGESYPKGIDSANLSILECVFIVAHEFANELYKIAFRPEKIPKAIENVLSFSNRSGFRQVRTAFLDSIVSKYQKKLS